MSLRSRAALALAACAAVAGGMLSCHHEPRPVRLVLVTLDTLRYDALMPPAGDAASTMPLLLARARDGGTLFERYYSACSVTQPTHASLLTGLHPWEHGVVSNGQVLRDEIDTLAELLHADGYATSAVVASFPVAAQFGFGQGFDAFDDDFTIRRHGRRPWEGHQAPDHFYSLSGEVTARALDELDRLDAASADRQFLWLHYFDPHGPYGDTGAGKKLSTGTAYRLLARGRFPALRDLLLRMHAAYDRDVRFLDRQLDLLLSRLDEDSEHYETHVVIVSDHGESFGEAGAIAHGMRLTDEQIHVPLVVLSPRVAHGARYEIVGSLDVATTLVALSGASTTAPQWSSGRALTGDAPAAPEVTGMRRTFVQEKVVEVRLDGTEHVLPRLAFYAVDQAGDVVRGNAERVEAEGGPLPAEVERRYRRLFRGFERQLARSAVAAPTDEDLEKLRALGYLH